MGNTFNIHTKQTCTRKKTTIKYIYRWLPSESKRFGQNLGCPYYKEDGLKHDHDDLITCEFAIERKAAYTTAIIEKLNFLLTSKEICEGICRGINNCYNNSTRKKEKRNMNNPIDAHEIIGW